MQLDPSQVRAVELATSARFGVITGGPGTGKTTTLRAALDALDARSETYALASPTGKAARRMEEATGRSARTVHRLLEWSPWSGGDGGFVRNANMPLEQSAVFVDESSMLDTSLAASLFDAIDPLRTRLILIGDADQLPSVGPGRVFADVIDSGAAPVARLTTLHRAAAESWVCTQAPRVLAGTAPDVRPRADFEWLERENRGDALEAAIDAATERGAQLLVPQNVGPAGAEVFNARLQRELNPHGREAWKVGESTHLRLGDSVIHTRNDYTLGVMNGETGRVVDCSSDELRVDFGEPSAPRIVVYGRDQARSLRLAYALTVHKSQGSEWPWVCVFCHSTHARMLTRQLFYTAITRAKQGVVLVGDRAGLEYAVRQTRDADRLTALKERIQAEIGRRDAAPKEG